VIPFHIETLYRHQPWANWALLGATLLAGVALQAGLFMPDEAEACFSLGAGSKPTLLTHLFAHDRIAPLVVDLLFLWVAGNAVCGLIGNLPFVALYASLGIVSGLFQLAIARHPVTGAGGAVAGMIGVCIAFFPTNTIGLYHPTWNALRAQPAPVWILLPYWGVWCALGAFLHLDATAPWGHIVGLVAGIGFGSVMVATRWVEFTDCDNGPLFMFDQQPQSTDEDNPAAAQARAELRRLARVYYEEYSTLPEIKVGASEAKRHRLTLRRSVGFARTATAASAEAQSRHAEASAETMHDHGQPVGLTPSAWPTDLPDVRFFHFDGAESHGPESRTEFLASLSLSADTSRWWFWAEGMQDWARVETLGQHVAAGFGDQNSNTSPLAG